MLSQLRNANPNDFVISSYTSQNGYDQQSKWQLMLARRTSPIASSSVNLHKHYRNPCSSTSGSSGTILGHILKGCTSYCRDPCSCMFIVALLLITSHWKQRRCSSRGNWIMKMCTTPWNVVRLFKKIVKSTDKQLELQKDNPELDNPDTWWQIL